MKVFFIGAGPGDPELLTVKAQRLLRECRICVYAGSLIAPEVLHLLPTDAEKHDSASMQLEEIVSVFQRARDRDIDVIRLHSGDPAIYGAIREQMNELDRLGIHYEVVPGVSSFLAAAAELKTELTAPEVSQAVVLTRTSGRTPVPVTQDLGTLAATKATLCIFLSVHKVEDIAKVLGEHYGKDCPVAVLHKVTWPDQRIVRGTLADIAEKVAAAGITKTALVIVGHALSRGNPSSKLYDAAFSHGYRAAKNS